MITPSNKESLKSKLEPFPIILYLTLSSLSNFIKLIKQLVFFG